MVTIAPKWKQLKDRETLSLKKTRQKQSMAAEASSAGGWLTGRGSEPMGQGCSPVFTGEPQWGTANPSGLVSLVERQVRPDRKAIS